MLGPAPSLPSASAHSAVCTAHISLITKVFRNVPWTVLLVNKVGHCHCLCIRKIRSEMFVKEIIFIETAMHTFTCGCQFTFYMHAYLFSCACACAYVCMPLCLCVFVLFENLNLVRLFE